MQETQLQQNEILAEKKENISKKSMHKKRECPKVCVNLQTDVR